MSNQNTSSILASYATLKSLLDEKKYQNSYQLLREFIRHIITCDSLYRFTAVEMKNLLEKHFCFSIPEAAVKTSLRNMDGISLDYGTYSVTATELGSGSLFVEKKKEADDYESSIVQRLTDYISSRTGITCVNEEALIQELTRFLTDDASIRPTQYADLIGEFVLKNENDQDVQDGLNKIREGSILYMGLSHSINEIGSITKPLTLYLGTEILFSLVGYNGEIYQQLATDFFNQVRIANLRKPNKITLRYFSVVKQEIDDFFNTASAIVEGKRRRLFDRQAMKSITDGCATASDVDVKRSDFYYRLQYGFGIIEDPHDDYYDEEHFLTNLESFEYEDEEDKNKKKEIAIKMISHINKRRNGQYSHNDIESEHLIVTNTKATLLISMEQVEKIKESKGEEHICAFAVSLDRITSLLWYKLGNGFSQKKHPLSINAVLKARVVLSTSIAKKAEKTFAEIKKQFEDGVITEDQVAARIITLRKKPTLPEELQEGDNIDEIMDFSPEYLSRYEEQFKKNQSALKEKDAVIESLQSDNQRTLSERDATITSQKEIIKAKDEENSDLRNKLSEYEHKEAEALRKIERRKNKWKFAWSILWKALIIIALVGLGMILEYAFDSKIPMYISSVVNIIVVVFTIWPAICKDKEKYLGKNQSNLNE